MSRRSCLLYDLYLPTLGGGERVVFAAAAALAADFAVVVAGPRLPDARRLVTLGFPTDVELRRLPPWRFPLASARCDLVIYLARRLPLPSLARRSLVISQFPFTSLSRRRLVAAGQRRLLSRYTTVAYSRFAADWIDRRWARTAIVVPPPVVLGTPAPGGKDNVILAVGRFFPEQQSKRQDVLIDAYRRLPDRVRSSWRLVLAGGLDGRAASVGYLDELRRQAVGHAISFEVDVPAARLEALYREASLFWHATGFGRRADQPESAEHFGITTVEAMSRGVVPMPYADGGQRELVDHGTGAPWTTVEQLVAATVALVDDPERRRDLARRAVTRAQSYGPDRFAATIRELAVES